MNIKKILSCDQDILYNVKGTSDLPEDIFQAVDYARTNYKNITPPFPELPLSKVRMFYWICHGFDELCRRTGERVEFTVKTDPHGNISVNAWCLDGERSQEYLPALVKAMESMDVDGIADHKYFPASFVSRADPLRETEHRENQRKRR